MVQVSKITSFLDDLADSLRAQKGYSFPRENIPKLGVIWAEALVYHSIPLSILKLKQLYQERAVCWVDVIKCIGPLVFMVLRCIHRVVWTEPTAQLWLFAHLLHFWDSSVISALASTSAFTWVRRTRILLVISPLGCTLSWANYVRDRKLGQVSGQMKLIWGCV